MRYYNYILAVSFILLVLPLSSALCELGDADIGSFQQNSQVTLWQTCPDCSFVNISSVLYPNSKTSLGQVAMVQYGTYFNYSYTFTDVLGDYTYKTFGNSTANGFCTQNIKFHITADGKPYRTFPIVYSIVILALSFLSFDMLLRRRYDTQIFSIFGAMLLVIGGILTLYPGFNYTNYSTLEGLASGMILIGIGGVIITVNQEIFN